MVFSVSASGTAPLTYQWSFNGAAIGGATGATYTIGTVTESHGGNYSVLISNGFGNVTSQDAVLTVQTIPRIVTQPQTQTVALNGPLTLSVAATGNPPPFTYQWSKNGVAIAGATGSTYAIANTALTDAGNYAVTVSNICGSTNSSPATVTIAADPPVIIAQPLSQVVKENTNNVSFSVSVTGTAPLSYQWLYNGVAINGATAATYLIGTVATSHAGLYSVRISNPIATVTSRPRSRTRSGLRKPRK